MNIKLLILLGITSIPLLSVGQTNPVFFNKGKMSIYSDNPNNTMLYVEGSFVISRDDTEPTVKSEIYVQNSKTVIKGDLIQDSPLRDKGGALFTDGVQGFVLPASYFTAPNVKSRIVFNGGQAQQIRTTLTPYNTEWKRRNYLTLPDIEVDNTSHLTMIPEMAAQTMDIYLTTGRLILDSRNMKSTDVVYTGNTGTNSITHAVENSSLLAHLLVNDTATVHYGFEQIPRRTSLDHFGAIEVRLAVDPLDNSINRKSIIGTGSPFQQMHADYFMYNFLMHPFGNNILGYYNFSNPDPQTVLPAGEGYVIGIDLRGSNSGNYQDVNPDWGLTPGTGIDFNSRTTEKYSFSRFAYNNRNNIYPINYTDLSFFTDVTTAHAAYDGERISTKDVKAYIKDGFTYLSNPFTAPLDLSGLLTPTTSGAHPLWNVTIGDLGTDILPYVWILNPSSTAIGTVSQYPKPGGAVGYESNIHATYTYLLMRATGGTYDGDQFSADGNSAVIAPLQMFVIYGNRNTTGALRQITIPAKERRIKTASQFLRSTNTSQRIDDFVFEVVDRKTNAYDRTAIVLRTPKEILENSTYVSSKKSVLSIVAEENEIENANLRMVTEEGNITTTINSVIYTKDLEGTDTESLFLARPESGEVSTTLYLSPSQTVQDISIRAMRLNSMENVEEIWLIDHLKNKEFLLSTGQEYITQVNPSDKHDRFTVKFNLESTTGIEEETETAKSISSHYNSGVLTIKGFEDSDVNNSIISVYDVQGRMLRQAKVDRLEMTIYETFTPGAYVVKVIGNNKSYVSKFLAR